MASTKKVVLSVVGGVGASLATLVVVGTAITAATDTGTAPTPSHRPVAKVAVRHAQAPATAAHIVKVDATVKPGDHVTVYDNDTGRYLADTYANGTHYAATFHTVSDTPSVTFTEWLHAPSTGTERFCTTTVDGYDAGNHTYTFHAGPGYLSCSTDQVPVDNYGPTGTSDEH